MWKSMNCFPERVFNVSWQCLLQHRMLITINMGLGVTFFLGELGRRMGGEERETNTFHILHNITKIPFLAAGTLCHTGLCFIIVVRHLCLSFLAFMWVFLSFQELFVIFELLRNTRTCCVFHCLRMVLQYNNFFAALLRMSVLHIIKILCPFNIRRKLSLLPPKET